VLHRSGRRLDLPGARCLTPTGHQLDPGGVTLYKPKVRESMFRESIQRMIDRLDGDGAGGGAAGVLMGFDGIAVDSYARGGAAEVQTIGMEMTHIVAEIRRTAQSARLGGLHEMQVKTDRLALLFQLVSQDYFLVLGVPPGGNLGKARYLLRLLAPEIRSEL